MILVTGGTGLVGAHLLYDLCKNQETVRAIRRASSELEPVKKIFEYYSTPAQAIEFFNRIEWVEAPVNDIPALKKAFQGIETVYHCAALISFDPSDEKKLRKTNIEGTANIVNLCISNNIKKLCYVSSVAALGSERNLPITEDSIWNPEENKNSYAISKYGAEIEVWRGSQEGLEVIIVNPGVIIGPGLWNSGSGKIFKKLDKGLRFHFSKITGFVGVYDVVNAMKLLMNSNLKNKKFILVAENLSFETVLKMTASLLNEKKPTIALKKWMVFFGWIFQKTGSWFGFKRNLTHDSIHSLFAETHYDSSKIQQELNFSFTPIEKVLAHTSIIYRKDHPN